MKKTEMWGQSEKYSIIKVRWQTRVKGNEDTVYGLSGLAKKESLSNNLV